MERNYYQEHDLLNSKKHSGFYIVAKLHFKSQLLLQHNALINELNEVENNHIIFLALVKAALTGISILFSQIVDYLSMFGWQSRFMSWTSLSMFALLLLSLFIFRAMTWSEARWRTWKTEQLHFMLKDRQTCHSRLLHCIHFSYSNGKQGFMYQKTDF